ncbi:MAG TPA: helix-hairpin-helix domain-containing protein [Propionibacteriaceae bacterium]
MERRRPRLDPVLAAQVNERLALVLAEPTPRRAQAVLAPDLPEVAENAAMAAQPDHGPVVGDAEPEVLELGPVDDLPPPRRFGRGHVGVVAVLVVIAMVIAGWTMLRARPVAVANPGDVVTAASGPAGSAPGNPGTPTPTAAPPIVVHVLGAVRKPGLVSLPAVSRVQDAIKAAGGLTSDADPGELNLAQLVGDGQQVMIGSERHPVGEVRDGGGGGGSTGGGASTGSSLDLNRATQEQLESLPGVGPVTAGKIVAWRTEHSRFSRVEELQEVDGIGPKTYAQIAPHVRV